MTFIKRSGSAPPGFFAVEAAGLRWLEQAGGASVVGVKEVRHDALVLERLIEIFPTRAQAREFGAALARTHNAGAPAFGHAPGAQSWFGPLGASFEVSTESHGSFAEFWASRLTHVRDLARPMFSAAGVGVEPVDAAIDIVRSGRFDGIAGTGREEPSRLHGDLWSGNVMWTVHGGLLIDPAAHGGHRLEDLAMLELFGAPHLAEIFAGYESVHPMPRGWHADLPAHSFFGLLAHAYLFSGSYVEQSARAAGRITALG